jgi:hypothetical protein
MTREQELLGDLNAHRQGWTTYTQEQLAAMRAEVASIKTIYVGFRTQETDALPMDAKILAQIDALSRAALVTLLDDIGVLVRQ